MKNDGSQEWVIIELQGDIESRAENFNFFGNFIGDLHFNEKGVPVLIIGHHILFGKIVNIEKPFAVLQKRPHSAGDLSSCDAPLYTIKSIIRTKLQFKSRPKPIITNVPKKT